MAQNAQIDALAAMAQRVYGELGKTLTLGGSGGAADSSLSAGVFKPTLDGLESSSAAMPIPIVNSPWSTAWCRGSIF